mgnify:CR=1 FL=1
MVSHGKTDNAALLAFCCRINDIQSIGLTKSHLHVGDDTHLSILVHLQTNLHEGFVTLLHALTLLDDEIADSINLSEVLVELDTAFRTKLSTILLRGRTDVDV